MRTQHVCVWFYRIGTGRVQTKMRLGSCHWGYAKTRCLFQFPITSYYDREDLAEKQRRNTLRNMIVQVEPSGILSCS